MTSNEAKIVTQTRACIFGCNTDVETGSSHEHIIPQVLGGWFYILDVCGECNNTIGHELEGQYMRNGYIVAALDKLGLQSKKEAYRFADIQIKSDTQGALKASFDDRDNLRLLPQPSPQDQNSLLIPDEQTKDVLKKQITRYQKRTGDSVNFNPAVVDRIPQDVPFIIPGTDIGFIRRSFPSKTVLYSGLSHPIPYRGIASIAFEQLAALSYPFIMRNEFDPIRHWIRYDGEEAKYVMLNNPIPKVAPTSLDYHPYHYVLFNHVDGALGGLVVLFGQLAFSIYMGEVPDIRDDIIAQCLRHYFLYDLENEQVILTRCEDERYQQELQFIEVAILSGRSYQE